MVVGSNPTIIICNGSLAYGNIGFGDGELNWKVLFIGINKWVESQFKLTAFHKRRRGHTGDT